ncbi:BTB/POZ domain-containing protein 6 [Chionoecetes opilio]|uniref:BTB/POZ domain-containing protein 6 n=1 Tax=Chionoecetes opilio TaxID=41210 RepID=A0A8J5CRI4_CHIOP|nr:BTB/POZ domain-containing protein 6 [Chionoecetes opilio]
MAEAGTDTGDWQTGRKYLSQRANHILGTGQWSDCSFLVGNENNQKTVHGHRLILAMSSPVFEAMFFGGLPEKSEKPIEILDVQPEAFMALLQYIYSDEINLKSFDQVCEICYAAKKYMIPSLVEQCTQFIWGDLYPGNVCRAYEFALLFEEPRLIEKCLQIIEKRTDEVLKDPSFAEMGLSTLRTVLQQETLNVLYIKMSAPSRKSVSSRKGMKLKSLSLQEKVQVLARMDAVSELVLWDALIKWTTQECARQTLEVNPENQRKVLGDCFNMVR